MFSFFGECDESISPASPSACCNLIFFPIACKYKDFLALHINLETVVTFLSAVVRISRRYARLPLLLLCSGGGVRGQTAVVHSVKHGKASLTTTPPHTSYTYRHYRRSITIIVSYYHHFRSRFYVQGYCNHRATCGEHYGSTLGAGHVASGGVSSERGR